MITLDALTVRFAGRTALDAVTAHLAEGGVHGFAGGRGTGKRVLLHALAGLVRPDSGGITRSGHPLRSCDAALVEQEPRFYPGLTGRDWLDLIVHDNPGVGSAPLVDALRLPLRTSIDSWPAAMRRKLALATALMRRTPLLLVDDPFADLDLQSREEVRHALLTRRAEGSTVVITARNPKLLESVADDIRILDAGRLAAEYRRDAPADADRELEELLLRYAGTTDSKKIN